MCYNHPATQYILSGGDVKIPALPTSKLSRSLTALKWLAILLVGTLAIRYGGEIVFYVPGVIAKKLSLALVGSSKGVVTSVLFYLVAAVLVLAIAAFGWSVTLVDKRLAARRRKPPLPR